MMTKRERQQIILSLVARNRIESQIELQDLLFAEGLAVTRSTLSRDLGEIGIVKGIDGYRLLGPGTSRPRLLRSLARAIRPLVKSWDVGGNIVILTPRSEADSQSVARLLADARSANLLASLSCGGRVIVVTRTAARARHLVRQLSWPGSRKGAALPGPGNYPPPSK